MQPGPIQVWQPTLTSPSTSTLSYIVVPSPNPHADAFSPRSVRRSPTDTLRLNCCLFCTERALKKPRMTLSQSSVRSINGISEFCVVGIEHPGICGLDNSSRADPAQCFLIHGIRRIG